MPLPADFQRLDEAKPKRRQPPDYTSRGTKLRLFAAVAGVMLVAAIVERGCDPRGLAVLEDRAERKEREAAPAAVADVEKQVIDDKSFPAQAEMFERFGLGPEVLGKIVDDVPVSADEESIVLRMLDGLPRMGRENLEWWRQEVRDWGAVRANASERRGEVFHVRGRARLVEKVTLTAEQAELREFASYYRVTVELADGRTPAVIFARNMPAEWVINGPLDEPVEVDGVFLKAGESKEGRRALVFVAEHVRWLPDRESKELGIGQGQVALAALGVDAGLWDDVRKLNHRPLEAGDREAFYEVLAAVENPAAAEVLTVGNVQLDVGAILTQPERFQGEVLPVLGTARRITRIDVPDAGVQTRLGIDHYYEIDLFLPLNGAGIRFGEKTGMAPEFRNSFPATLVVRQLPPGLRDSENLHEQVSAEGVFFKIWTYESRYAEQFGQVQPAPLFIAGELRVMEESAAEESLGSTLATIALTLTLAALLVAGWWMVRTGKRRSRALGPSPDFSGLAIPPQTPANKTPSR